MGSINLGKHLFESKKIPVDCDIVFVSDSYADEYTGGAELTTEALLGSCPLNVCRIKSSDVTLELLQQGYTKFWIFGNFANLDYNLIPSICANLKYAIIEYDYKYCRYRSPEKHLETEGVKCGCENEENGKMVSAFMFAARSLWWMSERQYEAYVKLFPFLKQRNNTILSSVFDDKTFATIKILRSKIEQSDRKGWIVLGSPSWIKGTTEAVEWCKANGHEYEIVWNIPYDDLLQKLAYAEGLVFLPKGGDTCPRIVIEAKLLGCKLHLNDNVQHKNEIWFDTDDTLDTESYLYLSRDRFWNGIKVDMEYRPTLSGYTTTKDCIKQDYPFIECITSMLGFCDQVVIVDGGSSDGTWEQLQKLAASDARVVIHQQVRDWNHPRFAIFDGVQKALARSLCTSEFCWQQDSDEIVHEDDYQKIKDLVRAIPRGIPLLSLPVIEYWGSVNKVRFDINVWKWRLSQNHPTITHGVPNSLRQYDENGNLYPKFGSDGSCYVRHDTYEVIPAASFYTPDMENVRQAAFTDPKARQIFESWFNQVIMNIPSVYHFSWFNIERKIKTYRDYWSKYWQNLYNLQQDDIPENNMFFDKSWSDVTDSEISDMARRLATEMGGWIFHRKLDFTIPTPHLTCATTPPKIMREWITRNS
jgi:glycosyltransferase involved in cell wall biosynthesis